jgi:hypothetical protein
MLANNLVEKSNPLLFSVISKTSFSPITIKLNIRLVRITAIPILRSTLSMGSSNQFFLLMIILKIWVLVIPEIMTIRILRT